MHNLYENKEDFGDVVVSKQHIRINLSTNKAKLFTGSAQVLV